MYIFILNWDLNAHLINIYLLLISQDNETHSPQVFIVVTQNFAAFCSQMNNEHYAQNTVIFCVCV